MKQSVHKYCTLEALQSTNKVSFAAFIKVVMQHLSPLRAVASNKLTKILTSVSLSVLLGWLWRLPAAKV